MFSCVSELDALSTVADVSRSYSRENTECPDLNQKSTHCTYVIPLMTDAHSNLISSLFNL